MTIRIFAIKRKLLQYSFIFCYILHSILRILVYELLFLKSVKLEKILSKVPARWSIIVGLYRRLPVWFFFLIFPVILFIHLATSSLLHIDNNGLNFTRMKAKFA